MLNMTPEALQALSGSHTALVAMRMLRPDGQVKAELPVVDFTVTCDRSAARLGSFEATLGDPDGTWTPESMADALGPGTNVVQLLRGVRVENVEQVGERCSLPGDWPVHTDVGQMSGVKVDTDGAVILAW